VPFVVAVQRQPVPASTGHLEVEDVLAEPGSDGRAIFARPGERRGAGAAETAASVDLHTVELILKALVACQRQQLERVGWRLARMNACVELPIRTCHQRRLGWLDSTAHSGWRDAQPSRRWH
jgi:hypothetical protein